ncbi:MAG: sulfatase-like hydrolase/transferase [bacterium]|nr:sulfatase-like hydrolase/transferase [bacterium]
MRSAPRDHAALHRLPFWRLAALAALAVVLAGCTEPLGPPEVIPPRGRVLILGIDGTAPRLVEEWMAAGYLPNLQSLAERGTSGLIRGDELILSPRIWTSVATGKDPGKHGIEGWVLKDAGENHLFQGSHRKGAALWNILSTAGLEVATVNWLATHPPEKVNGVVISELATPGRSQALMKMGRRFGWEGEEAPAAHALAATWPPEWLARVAGAGESEERLVTIRTPSLKLVQIIREEDELVARVALDVESETKPDLLMVLLQGNDRVSHFYWLGVEPRDAYPEEHGIKERRRIRAGESMLAYYRFTDSVVGLFLDRFGPDDLVLVLSDHGFEPSVGEALPEVTGTHDSDAAIEGVFFARGPGIPAGHIAPGVSVNDVTPTVLAWLGLPVARDMDGSVMGFLKGAPPDTIDSYDSIPIERLDVQTKALDARILERLKALGYVE